MSRTGHQLEGEEVGKWHGRRYKTTNNLGVSVRLSSESLAWVLRALGRLPRAFTTPSNIGVLALILLISTS